jgi:hypothetical protein
MTIKPAPSFVQPWLLDVPPDKTFGTNGAARTHYGAVVQQSVCALLGLVEIRNSGNYDVVFDAACPYTKRFFEIKSVHYANKAPIYCWRREKETATGLDPLYAFCLHHVRGARSMSECWQALTRDFSLAVVVLPLSEVNRLCDPLEVRQVVKERPGSRMGYERKGYCEGYQNLPVRAILDAVHTVPKVHREVEVHGFPLSASLFVHPAAGWSPRG